MEACCRINWLLKTPCTAAANIQQAAWTQTHLDYSLAAKLLANKGNGTLHHPSLWKVALERKKNNLSSYLTNTSLFEVQTRKNEGLFSGLALHMTAIWGYCVFWPKRVVYDRWQERKSQAAGLSTETQIAFSWLPYSAWYLSSGLQYSLFIYSQEAADQFYYRREERELMFFLCWVKVQTPQVVSEHCEIKCMLYCILFYHTKRNNIQKYRWYGFVLKSEFTNTSYSSRTSLQVISEPTHII